MKVARFMELLIVITDKTVRWTDEQMNKQTIVQRSFMCRPFWKLSGEMTTGRMLFLIIWTLAGCNRRKVSQAWNDVEASDLYSLVEYPKSY